MCHLLFSVALFLFRKTKMAGGHRAREAVEEWLRFHGCHATLAALHREMIAYEQAQESFGGEPAHSYEWRKKACTKMLELFDGGHRCLFWSAWEKYVPSSIRETDENISRLVVLSLSAKGREGLLPPLGRAGGGIRAGAPDGLRSGDQCAAIDALTSHLDGRGRALVESGECAQYCAFAVLRRPWEGSQLKDLFQPAWSTSLRNKVLAVLPQLLRPPAMPRLATLVSGVTSGMGLAHGAAQGETGGVALEGALELAREVVAKLDVVLAEAGKSSSEAYSLEMERFRGRLRGLMSEVAERATKARARPSSGVVEGVLGAGDDARIAIGVGLREAGPPDFRINICRVLSYADVC